MRKPAVFFIFLLFQISLSSSEQNAVPEENFLIVDGYTGMNAVKIGSNHHVRISPCSTFKILLCLLGFEEGILKSPECPVWEYREGYDDYLVSWRASQNPASWIKNSCIWYSKVLAEKLGMEKIENMLIELDYGNRDLSAGLQAPAWVSSSLKISLEEQIHFIKKMVLGPLPFSEDAIQATKELIFIDEVKESWFLYGKTGGGSIAGPSGEPLKIGLFIGWIEKGDRFFPLAYSICDTTVDHAQKVPRTKELICDFLNNLSPDLR